MSDYGYIEDETCGRRNCDGVIKERAVENCSCHIAPPCGACTEARGYCEKCNWDAGDDMVMNDYVVNVDRATGNYRFWEPRPLDATKIDWRSLSHTNFSMIKEGVYPPGTTSEQVLAAIGQGTFGGRFEYFCNGKFKYIAYTD